MSQELMAVSRTKSDPTKYQIVVARAGLSGIKSGPHGPFTEEELRRQLANVAQTTAEIQGWIDRANSHDPL
jgi:hypothetical protein